MLQKIRGFFFNFPPILLLNWLQNSKNLEILRMKKHDPTELTTFGSYARNDMEPPSPPQKWTPPPIIVFNFNISDDFEQIKYFGTNNFGLREFLSIFLIWFFLEATLG